MQDRIRTPTRPSGLGRRVASVMASGSFISQRILNNAIQHRSLAGIGGETFNMDIMLKRYFFALFICVSLIAQRVNGEAKNNGDLTFEVISNDITCPDCTTVRITGILGQDAPLRLKVFLSENNVPEGANVDLNSPGGLLSSGIELGQLIRAYPLRTSIGQPPNSSSHLCASACAFAFFGGVERIIHNEGRLGLHQFYGGTSNAYTESITQFIVGDLLEFAERMGIDARVIREAAQTPPEEMTWLDKQQLEHYGIVTGKADASGTNWQLRSDSSQSDKKTSATPTLVGSRVQTNGQVANFEIGCPMSPFSTSDRLLADQRIERMLYLLGGRQTADVISDSIPDDAGPLETGRYFSLLTDLRMGLFDRSAGRLVPVLINLHGQSVESMGEICGLDGCEFPAHFSFEGTGPPRFKNGIHEVLGGNMVATLFDIRGTLDENRTFVGGMRGFGPGWYPFTQRVFRNRRVFVTYVDIDDMRTLVSEPSTEMKLELEPKMGRIFVRDTFLDYIEPPVSELLFPSLSRGFDLSVFLEICESQAPDRTKSLLRHRYDYLDSSDDPKRPLPSSSIRQTNKHAE